MFPKEIDLRSVYISFKEHFKNVQTYLKLLAVFLLWNFNDVKLFQTQQNGYAFLRHILHYRS